MIRKSHRSRLPKIYLFAFFAFLAVLTLIGTFSLLSNNDSIRKSLLRESNEVNIYEGSYHITEPPPTASPVPKPTYPEVADIQDMKWIPYEATCEGLKENVTIYYPESWKLGYSGETTITDFQNDKSECMINIGYPFSPGHRQNPYVEGLHGYIVVGSYLAPGKQLRDIMDEYNQNRIVKDAYVTTVANREWVKYLQGGEIGYSKEDVLITVYKGRQYTVSYGAVDRSTISGAQNELLFAVGEQFVNKLQFH